MSTRVQQDASIEQIDARLPQTQCTQCGYPRCRAYAEAIARGDADINQCPPGNEVTILALATLLHMLPKPLDPHFGAHRPRARAVIEEALCIGCRQCIEVCPVDAILGARRLMHTVIAGECTGCELCLPPCPVNCIAIVPLDPVPDLEPWPEYARVETDRWRARTARRLERLTRHKRRRRGKSTGDAPSTAESTAPLAGDRERIRAEVRAAVARVKQKRNRQD